MGRGASCGAAGVADGRVETLTRGAIGGGEKADVIDRRRRVDAALEAVPGVGRELIAARAAGNRVGPPERGFDV